MTLTVFAATGGVGRQLLAQAVAAGHDVTAVVRNQAKLAAQPIPQVPERTFPAPATSVRLRTDGVTFVDE